MVKMSEQKNMAPDSSLASKGFNINPLDILRFLLSKWYWFALSVAIFGGWAWYRYSTTQFRYSTNSTVMFKDAHASARQAGLDRLANSTPQVNISNEILQFQSPELMRKAVLRLHAEVDYTVMDYLRVEELYSRSPVKVSFLDITDDQTASLQVTPIDDEKVRLAGFTTGGPLTAPLGKTVRTPLGKLNISKTLYYNKEWYGRTINVFKNDINVTVSQLCPNLSITQASAEAASSYGFGNTSSILYMNLSDVNPTRAEDILNTLIAIYNEETISDKNQIAINTSNFIDERLAIIEKELSGVEGQIQEFKEAHDMIDLGSVTSTEQGHRERYSTEVKDLLLQQQTGHYLRARKEEGWITPYVEAVIGEDKAAVLEAEREAERAAAEAAKPKVTIDLSGLDRIRRDAAITRESLLTEDEKAEFRPEPQISENAGPVREELSVPENDTSARSELPVPDEDVPARTEPPAPAPAEPQAVAEAASETVAEVAGLDSIHTRILAEIMRNGAVTELIKEHHLMPSVVADAINEALFDEIGDNVLTCDGNEIELVEDYRLDLEDLLGDI